MTVSQKHITGAVTCVPGYKRGHYLLYYAEGLYVLSVVDPSSDIKQLFFV